MKFSDYIDLFEMAMRPPERRVYFDDIDTKYLSQFKPTKEALAVAFRYRYGPKVLDSNQGEVHSIDTLPHPVRAAIKPGLTEINVYGQHLISKLQKLNYMPSLVDVGKTTATTNNWAKKELEYMKSGNPDDRAVWHPLEDWEEGHQKTKNELRHGKSQATNFGKSSEDDLEGLDKKVRKPMTLDEDDMKLIHYFLTSKSAMPYLYTVFRMKYSDKLLNMEPMEEIPELPISGSAGKTMILYDVPINTKTLHDRLKQLKDDMGKDFTQEPMADAAARRLIGLDKEAAEKVLNTGGKITLADMPNFVKGKYNPNWKKKESNPDRSRYDRFAMQQKDALLGMADSPNIPEEGKKRDREKEWDALVHDNAKEATHFAIREMVGMYAGMYDFKTRLMSEFDDILALTYTYILSGISGDERYAEEKYRISMGIIYAKNLIKRKFVHRKGAASGSDMEAERDNIAHTAADTHQDSEERAPTKVQDLPPNEDHLLAMVKDFAKSQGLMHHVPPEAREQVVKAAIKAIKGYMQHKKGEPVTPQEVVPIIKSAMSAYLPKAIPIQQEPDEDDPRSYRSGYKH